MAGRHDPKMEEKQCWNTIGVWGSETPRCKHLDQLAHCRNCPVFVEAGSDLFDREPPEGYLETWTRALAAEKASKATETTSVLVFRLEQEWFAMATQRFKEVSEMQHIHKIPHTNDPVILGLINIRGELQLCVSLHTILEIERKDDAAPTDGLLATSRMVVAEKDHATWVFPADEVYGIHRYDPKRLQNVPATVSRAASTYTRGIFMLEDRKVGHLDDALLFGALNRRIS